MEREKSLTEIWSKALPNLRKDRLNDFLRYSGLLAGGVISGTLPECGLSIYGQIGIALAAIWAGLLGFVVAGYTIFTAMNPNFMLVLGKIEESHSKYSHLKVRLLIFTRLFIVMFVGLVSFVAIYLFALIYPLYHIVVPPQLRVVGCVALGSCLGVCMTAGFTELKILIFNLYDLTLTQVEMQKIAESEN